MQTFYANFITMKMTPSEMVLEFSYHLPPPGTPPGAIPVGLSPEVRVVLLSSALDSFIANLEQARKARDSMTAQQRPPVGFNPGRSQ